MQSAVSVRDDFLPCAIIPIDSQSLIDLNTGVRDREQFGLTQIHFAIQSIGKSSFEASVLYGSTIARASAHDEINSHEHLLGCVRTGSLRLVA